MPNNGRKTEHAELKVNMFAQIRPLDIGTVIKAFG